MAFPHRGSKLLAPPHSYLRVGFLQVFPTFLCKLSFSLLLNCLLASFWQLQLIQWTAFFLKLIRHMGNVFLRIVHNLAPNLNCSLTFIHFPLHISNHNKTQHRRNLIRFFKFSFSESAQIRYVKDFHIKDINKKNFINKNFWFCGFYYLFLFIRNLLKVLITLVFIEGCGHSFR